MFIKYNMHCVDLSQIKHNAHYVYQTQHALVDLSQIKHNTHGVY